MEAYALIYGRASLTLWSLAFVDRREDSAVSLEMMNLSVKSACKEPTIENRSSGVQNEADLDAASKKPRMEVLSVSMPMSSEDPRVVPDVV